MSYITLADAKKHLNIDSGFTEDDGYITALIEAAETAVERHIDYPLTYIAGQFGGSIPTPLLHAMKLIIGSWYMTREAITYGSVNEVPQSYNYLLDLYRNYGTEHNTYINNSGDTAN